jgi:hypothetical protein
MNEFSLEEKIKLHNTENKYPIEIIKLTKKKVVTSECCKVIYKENIYYIYLYANCIQIYDTQEKNWITTYLKDLDTHELEFCFKKN